MLLIERQKSGGKPGRGGTFEVCDATEKQLGLRPREGALKEKQLDPRPRGGVSGEGGGGVSFSSLLYLFFCHHYKFIETEAQSAQKKKETQHNKVRHSNNPDFFFSEVLVKIFAVLRLFTLSHLLSVHSVLGILDELV